MIEKRDFCLYGTIKESFCVFLKMKTQRKKTIDKKKTKTKKIRKKEKRYFPVKLAKPLALSDTLKKGREKRGPV